MYSSEAYLYFSRNCREQKFHYKSLDITQKLNVWPFTGQQGCSLPITYTNLKGQGMKCVKCVTEVATQKGPLISTPIDAKSLRQART